MQYHFPSNTINFKLTLHLQYHHTYHKRIQETSERADPLCTTNFNKKYLKKADVAAFKSQKHKELELNLRINITYKAIKHVKKHLNTHCQNILWAQTLHALTPQKNWPSQNILLKLSSDWNNHKLNIDPDMATFYNHLNWKVITKNQSKTLGSPTRC